MSLKRCGQLAQRVDVELGVLLDSALALRPPRSRPRSARPRSRARRCRTSARSAGRSPRQSGRCPSVRASPSTDSSLSPRFRTVSSIPGIDSRAPERTDTSSGSSPSPKRLPACCSSRPSASATWSAIPVGLGAVGAHVLDARLGRDRESGRDAVGPQNLGHLGDVRALASEQLRACPWSLRRSRTPTSTSDGDPTLVAGLGSERRAAQSLARLAGPSPRRATRRSAAGPRGRG